MEKKVSKILKSFEVDGKQLHLVEPNLQIIRDSKYRYTQVFTDALKQGFYTKKKLEAILKEDHGDIVADHLEKRSDILRAMADTQTEIETSQDPQRIRYLVEVLKLYRESLFQEDLSIKNLFDNTADTLAEEERVDFLTFSLVRDENLEKMWISFGDFMSDPDYTFIEKIKYQFLCWEFKLDPNEVKNLSDTAALERAELLESPPVIKPPEVDATIVPKVPKVKAKKKKARK